MVPGAVNHGLKFLKAMRENLHWLYSQTCIKRSPLGHRKSGLIRQVTS